MQEVDKADEDFTVDTSMISQSSPYQPTTEPIPNRKQICCLTMDLSYIKSLQGITNLAFVLLSLVILFILIPASGNYGMLLSTGITSLILYLFFIFIFAFRFNDKITIINWPMTLLLNIVIQAVFWFIASCILAASSLNVAGVVAVILGFLDFILHGVKFYFQFQEFRSKNMTNN